MLAATFHWASPPRRRGKDECALALWLLLSCVDLIVSGRVLIKMATPVTPVTASAALVLFPTDSDDLERGNDSGTPLPTSDNGDNSLGYTGRVHLSKIFLDCLLLTLSTYICHYHLYMGGGGGVNHLCYLSIFHHHPRSSTFVSTVGKHCAF